MDNPKTAEIYWTLVDPPIEGENNSKPKANFQKISACQRLRSQMLFTELRNTEINFEGPSDGRSDRQPTSQAPIPSRLATRIREGKPGSPHCKVLRNWRRRNTPGNLLPTWPRHPRLAHANSVSVELHPNGTTRRAGRPHSEREHHDRCALPRLQMLWHITTGTTN